ncbi:TetR/AcrR family transcriptional regulator C-terminal domain-containing protein [Kitasatospora sp. NPDC057223]|uniref:TetR/AcrR family transcriptional regulator C-terminal domain-containing protein n=1 Tax=Kitasatospora sp. NPDC057223 TaxID=3346055 RepID=UPI00363F697B
MTESAAQPVPPSVRILTELRRRIAAGELSPGDRVPSTRRITQEWGVAMATATKALSTLRQEGLVRAVPGVGTVVAGPSAAAPAPSAPPPSEPPAPPASPAPPPQGGAPATAPVRRARGAERELTRERIVRAAVGIADAEGIGALAMRRIAAELGAATMSLYRHVADKDQLVLLMMDQVMVDNPLPEALPPGWRAGLETIARTQWQIYRRHPWLAVVMSFTRPVPSPAAAIHTERSMAALAGLGLGMEQIAQTAVTLAGYVCGLAVNFESEAAAERDSGLSSDEWLAMTEGEGDLGALVEAGEFPMFTALAEGPEIDLSLDGLFEFGLARMLDGVGLLIAGRPAG